ncbi:MAG: hypothetical protein ACKOAH_24450, partial [Pirellula sp.]
LVGFARIDIATRGRSSSSHPGVDGADFYNLLSARKARALVTAHSVFREPETDTVSAGGKVASPHPSVGFWSDGLNPTSYQIGRVFGCLSMAKNQVKLESRKD